MSVSLLRRRAGAALDEAAAAWIAERLQRRPSPAPAVFGACGGRSVAGILRALAARRDVPWERVHLFTTDERRVPPGHADSNARLLRESLVAPLARAGRAGEANLHAFDFGGGRDAVGEVARDLDALGGRFDVALLSAGEDGHVAALFPDHASIRSEAATFVEMDDAPKPPPRRVSASRALLARTGAAVLLFVGESKRAALERFSLPAGEGPGFSLPPGGGPGRGFDVVSCPARLVRQLPEALVLTDLDAP